MGRQGRNARTGEVRGKVAVEGAGSPQERLISAEPAAATGQVVQITLDGRLVSGDGRQIGRGDLGILDRLDEVVEGLVDR